MTASSSETISKAVSTAGLSGNSLQSRQAARIAMAAAIGALKSSDVAWLLSFKRAAEEYRWSLTAPAPKDWTPSEEGRFANMVRSAAEKYEDVYVATWPTLFGGKFVPPINRGKPPVGQFAELLLNGLTAEELSDIRKAN